jgi:uncharacterized protein
MRRSGSVTSVAGLIALGTIGAPALAAALEVPAAQGRVTDLAEMLEPDRRARLEAALERAQSASGIEVRVLTLPTLAGDDLAEFSVRVARAWGIGHEGRDDGALLLLVRDDRLLRLEVGYGLEAELTDLESKHVLDDVVVPRLRAGAPGEAIEAGVGAVFAALGVELPEAPRGPPAGLASRIAAVALGGSLLLFATLRIASAPGVGAWFVFPFFFLPFWSLPALLSPAGPGRTRLALVLVATAAAAFALWRVWVRHTKSGRRWAAASRVARALGADREPEAPEPAEAASRARWRESGSRSSSRSGGGDFGGGGASSRW